MKPIQKHENEPVRSRLEDKQLCEMQLPNGETLSLYYEAGVVFAHVVGRPCTCGCTWYDPTTKINVKA